MNKPIFASLALLLLCFSSCGSMRHPTYRIGIDPSWFPLDTANKEANLFAFTNELLKEITVRKKVRLERVSLSWDNLLDAMHRGECDGVLTTMKPTILNEKQYQFSKIILKTGPVLIMHVGDKATSLEKMGGKILLVSKGAAMLDYMSNYPDIQLQFYTYVNDALEDLVKQRATGTMVPLIPASSYVSDIYFNDLHIVSKPLLDEGIRLAMAKQSNDRLLTLFDEALQEMRHDGSLEKLIDKWSLPPEMLSF